MTLSLDLVIDDGLHFDDGAALERLLADAAALEPGVPAGDWELAIRLCSDAAIAELHAAYFDDPTPTDVITFPSGESGSASDGYLGDIVISLETAASQAVDIGHARDREVAFLALHGLLHLAGWSDDTEQRRAAMLERQRELLERFEGHAEPSW